MFFFSFFKAEGLEDGEVHPDVDEQIANEDKPDKLEIQVDPSLSREGTAVENTMLLQPARVKVRDRKSTAIISGSVHLPKCQTTLHQQSFIYRGAKVWNSLFAIMCDCTSPQTFKRK